MLKTIFGIAAFNKIFQSDIWDKGIFNGLWKIASTYPIHVLGILSVLIGFGYLYHYLNKNFVENEKWK